MPKGSPGIRLPSEAKHQGRLGHTGTIKGYEDLGRGPTAATVLRPM